MYHWYWQRTFERCPRPEESVDYVHGSGHHGGGHTALQLHLKQRDVQAGDGGLQPTDLLLEVLDGDLEVRGGNTIKQLGSLAGTWMGLNSRVSVFSLSTLILVLMKGKLCSVVRMVLSIHWSPTPPWARPRGSLVKRSENTNLERGQSTRGSCTSGHCRSASRILTGRTGHHPLQSNPLVPLKSRQEVPSLCGSCVKLRSTPLARINLCFLFRTSLSSTLSGLSALGSDSSSDERPHNHVVNMRDKIKV
jgi:hypothetical protein